MTTQRSNIGSLIGGAMLVIFGVLALLGQWLGAEVWGQFWPVILIGIGLVFFAGALAGQGGKNNAFGIPAKDTAALAIPGSILTTLGVVLWLQQAFGYYQSWSYGWAIIIVAVGLGIFIMGWLQADAKRRAEGVRLMKVGLVLFIIFGAFFEMIFRSFSGFEYLFPAALIVLGLYLVITRLMPRANTPIETPEPHTKTS